MSFNAAKKLWKKANSCLDDSDVEGYLALIDQLHQCMEENGLEIKVLRAQLVDEEISQWAWAILAQIYACTSNYSRVAATHLDSTVESGFVSAIGKKMAFFIDCKLEVNERAPEVDDCEIDKASTYIIIMQHVCEVSNSSSKIGNFRVAELMEYKISSIEQLVDREDVNDDSLDQVLGKKIPINPLEIVELANQGINTYLQHRQHECSSSRSGFFSKSSSQGIERAEFYKAILEGDNIPVSHQLAAITALLASKNGRTLQSFVINELECENRVSAIQQVQGVLSEHHNDELVAAPKNPNGASKVNKAFYNEVIKPLVHVADGRRLNRGNFFQDQKNSQINSEVRCGSYMGKLGNVLGNCPGLDIEAYSVPPIA